jgi:hypothetical protein
MHLRRRDVFLRSHISSDEIAVGVDRRQIADAGGKSSARKGSQTGSCGLVGPVNHRSVNPRRDLIDLLAWVVNAGGFVESRPR